MGSPVSLAEGCFQWGANTSFLSRNVPLHQCSWKNYSENAKGLARVIYMIGVSTLIAPVGIAYHLSQAGLKTIHSLIATDANQANALSELAWKHFDCAEKDAVSLTRGCAYTHFALAMLGLAGGGFIFGVQKKDLILAGVCSAFFAFLCAHSVMDGSFYLFSHAWEDLTCVANELNHDINQRDFAGSQLAKSAIISIVVARYFHAS